MAWDTKMSTLLASAMIGEAAAVEFLRSLPADARKPAIERMSATLQASLKQFSETEIGNPADSMKHKIMIDDLTRRIEPMLKTLLDLASDG